MKFRALIQSVIEPRGAMWSLFFLLSACAAPQSFTDRYEGTVRAEAAYIDGRYQDTVDVAKVSLAIPIEGKNKYFIEDANEYIRRLRFVQGEAKLKLGSIEGLDEELMDLRSSIYDQKHDGWLADSERVNFLIARTHSMQGKDVEAVNRLLVIAHLRRTYNGSDEEEAAIKAREDEQFKEAKERGNYMYLDPGWRADQAAAHEARVQKVIQELEDVLRENPGSDAARLALIKIRMK